MSHLQQLQRIRLSCSQWLTAPSEPPIGTEPTPLLISSPLQSTSLKQVYTFSSTSSEHIYLFVYLYIFLYYVLAGKALTGSITLVFANVVTRNNMIYCLASIFIMTKDLFLYPPFLSPPSPLPPLPYLL